MYIEPQLSEKYFQGMIIKGGGGEVIFIGSKLRYPLNI